MASAGDLVAGRYRLLTQLGSGGMGVVWTARDEESGETVALKQVRLSEFAPDEDSDGAREILRNEATTAARLVHPHIVPVHRSVEQDGEPWLVMELVPGRDLARLVAEDGPLPPRRAARIGAQIAAALAHAHDEQVVHRDVTPRNILVGDGDVAKLTDFGISRVGEGTVAGGPAQGVPAYYAPETANGVRPGPRTDVFALGAVLYAAVEGEPPWGTGNDADVIDRASRGVVTPPRRAGRRLRGVLMRMLRRQPRHRPHAAEAEQMLRRVADGRARTGRIAAAIAVPVAVAVGVTVLVWPSEADAMPGMGEPRTADPCSLISAAPFGRFGHTALEIDYANFNRCDVTIETGAIDVLTRVQFEPAGPALPDGPVETRGRITVVRGTRIDDECTHVIRLPDGYDVEAIARIDRGDMPDLCAIADTTADLALAVLERGEVPRRPEPFPAASLATVDSCMLLAPVTIQTVPGLDAANPDRGFGSWECEWDTPDTDADLIVRYDRHIGGTLDEDRGAPTRVGDRDGALEADPANGECDVTVRHRSYVNPDGEVTSELLIVEVTQPAPVPDPCGPALPIAEEAVSKLPAT